MPTIRLFRYELIIRPEPSTWQWGLIRYAGSGLFAASWYHWRCEMGPVEVRSRKIEGEF